MVYIKFIISLIIGFIFIKPLNSKIFILLFFSLTFIFVVMTKPKTAGTLWCFSAAILAPVLAIGNYYIIKNLKNSQITS